MNTQKLINLINEFSKVIGYKIKMQKLFVFLYTSNKLSKNGTKIILFTIASKKNKSA